MAKKIKLLSIINRYNLGGITYNVSIITAKLSDKFETKMIGGAHEKYEGNALFIPQEFNVNPIVLENLQREINFKQDKKAYQEIRQIIKEFKPDIVHTHASKAGVIGRLAALKENVPVIVHTFHGHIFHSYFSQIKTQFYKIIERYLAKKSSAIITISENQKNELVNIYRVVPKNKARVINLGFDFEKFQTNKPQKRLKFAKEYKIKDDEICIGVIGRLTAIKNHQMFFDVIKNIINKTNKKIRVFIIGGGELEKELKCKADRIEQEFGKSIFTFTSWIKDVDVPLSRLDIVCLTSSNEGTPVSLIEAQASSVVVISTNVGGVKDIMIDGKTGYVIDDFSIEEYSNKLLDLIENEEKRKNMSQNGWDYVKEKFHYTTLCKNMENLYLELLKKNENQK